ncbi:E3 SUMO-protein ligase ZBED1-like [Prorops nasuta]|uniref:E3 SUMO-protein ligase ZBED1-like n=1 Tax=Prorops nasuta TaxID=863751 RepID=UPI0034CE73C1
MQNLAHADLNLLLVDGVDAGLTSNKTNVLPGNIRMPRSDSCEEACDDPNYITDEVNLTRSLSSSSLESVIVSKQPRIDYTLLKQNSYQAGGQKATQITNCLVYMIAKDNMPYQTVEKIGFQTFVKTLCPLYNIPSRATITRLIEEKFLKLSESIKLQLHKTENLSLTTDIWTDTLNVKSFLGLTCHYIHNDKHKSVALGVTELNDAHTSDNIRIWLLNVIDEWKICHSSIVTIVSDNGANIKKAIRDGFGAKKQLSCFAHTINLIPSKVLEDGQINYVYKKVKSIITYIKKSVIAMDSLRAISNLKLIQSVDTRWKSAHDMLERFVELSDKIGTILLKFPAAPSMIHAKELQTLIEFIELLKPFKEATKIISGEYYLTASKVIPIISTLRIAINKLEPATEEGNEMKQQLLEQFDFRFKNLEEETILMQKLASISKAS